MVASRLPGLLPAPDDFRARCDAVDAMAGARGHALRQLGAHELNERQLVSGAIATHRARGRR